MRIVLVNWAHLWDGANKGGGVNGYAQALALELARRGHDLVYLSAGVTYTPGPGGTGVGACEVRRHPDWLGVRVFEVINSPVLAPAIDQFRDPASEASCPLLESEVGAFFRLIRPDVVHFHNIEGFSAGCIAQARRAGARAVYSLHNYHTICPQAYLMRRHRDPCFNYRGGLACETCMDAADPGQTRAARARGVTVSARSAPEPAAPEAAAQNGRPVLRQLLVELKSLINPPGLERTGIATEPVAVGVADARGAVAAIGRGVSDEASVLDAFPPVATDTRGQTQHLLAEGVPYIPNGPDHPDWRPLENAPTPDPSGPVAQTPYGLRRAAMVEALNGCDAVLAVSEFVRAKFEAMGVRGDRLRTLHIGTRANRIVEQLPDLLFDPPPFEIDRPRPIRLVFMGFNNYYKGLEMLADSLELLTPEYLARYHVFIYAQEGQNIEWRFRRIEPKLGGLTVNHGYRYYDIPWMLGGKDLGIVPSVWWDNAPQTVFEYLACGVPVLGARLGGIPDFVRHGENGLLFRGNDRYDLARTLAGVARNPSRIFELRKGVRRPKDIQEHARELETLYNECLCSTDRRGA